MGDQRPNLMNLSRGLNLRPGSNMVGSSYNCIEIFQDLSWCSIENGFWRI